MKVRKVHECNDSNARLELPQHAYKSWRTDQTAERFPDDREALSERTD
jgi:hypothetical protein